MQALKLEGCDLVFPNRVSKPYSDPAMTNTLRNMGYAKLATVHGFRSTFRDWAIRQGVVDEVRAACSAHSKQDKVQAAYERKDFYEQRVPVMLAWADYLA